MNIVTDRILGGLWGVHAGDSLGSFVEFMTASQIRRLPALATNRGRHDTIRAGGPFDWNAGDATDDTDCTMAVARAYSHPDSVVTTAAVQLLAWYQGRPPYKRPPRDIGNTTRAALERYSRTGQWMSGDPADRLAANGSLMRCIPTGLVRSSPKVRQIETVSISQITHGSIRCVDACVVYNQMVSCLVDGAVPHEAVLAGLDVERIDPRVRSAIQTGMKIDLGWCNINVADPRVGENREPYDGGGYVLASLSIAVAALLDPRDFRTVIADVVNLGGDTDTNGAIAGGLLGTAMGASRLPSDWIEPLQYREEMIDIAGRLTELRGIPHIKEHLPI